MSDVMYEHAHHRVWSGLTSGADDAEIGLLGIPFDGATSWNKGASFAPEHIRSITPHMANSTEQGHILREVRVRDYGDVKVDLNWERFFATVEQCAAGPLSHRLALFLGGDHSVTIPLINAFSRTVDGSVGVIQFDAHLDLANEYDGSKWSHACTQRRALELPNVSPEHLAFVGIRSWMDDERTFLDAKPGIKVHSAYAVAARGIESVAQDVVTQMADVEAIYFTFDIDGLDPAYAPGTGTPEAGGPSMRDWLTFARMIFASLPVRAMDIVEVAPPLDVNNITSLAALRAIYEVFGWVETGLER